MAEQQPPNTGPVVAIAMVVSALSLLLIAVLIYTGAIPMSENARFIASVIAGGAGFLDLLLGMFFFRKGQSS